MKSAKKILRLYLLGALLLATCNAPIGGIFPGMSSDESNGEGALDPRETSTPTPFIPRSPESTTEAKPTPVASATVPTLTATEEYPWGDFSPPASESPIAIPPPVPELSLPSEMATFVLLGSDEAPHRYGHRTDTIVLIALNKETEETFLISIPRDLYVYVPGWRVDRINTADLFGGWEMVSETFLYNFGIQPDYWVRVNFTGFEGAVDLLGGINVEVGKYLNDECAGVQWEYFPGTYFMDGTTALCYVRMRKTTSDFDRLRRQQEVMEAIFKRVLSLDGLTRVPQLYSEFNKHFDSNVGLGDILPLVPLAADLSSGEATVDRYSIDRTLTTSWIVPATGASVLLPDREAIIELFETVFES